MNFFALGDEDNEARRAHLSRTLSRFFAASPLRCLAFSLSRFFAVSLFCSLAFLLSRFLGCIAYSLSLAFSPSLAFTPASRSPSESLALSLFGYLTLAHSLYFVILSAVVAKAAKVAAKAAKAAAKAVEADTAAAAVAVDDRRMINRRVSARERQWWRRGRQLRNHCITNCRQ